MNTLAGSSDPGSDGHEQPPSAQDPTATGGVDPRYARAFLRLGRLIRGEDGAAAPTEAAAFDLEVARLTAHTARKQHAQSRLADLLSAGVSLETALLETMRLLFAAGEWHSARALAESVGRVPGGARASHLGQALAAHRRGWHQLALTELRQLDSSDVAGSIPVEAVEVALTLATEDALSLAREIADQHPRVDHHALVDLAGRFLATGDIDTANALVAEADRRGAHPLDERHRQALGGLSRWLKPRATPQLPSGSVAIGVLDYHSPDQWRSSTNVGDYIQTLAMLGNIARFTDTEFSGDDGVGALVTGLKDRVQPGLRLPGVQGTAHVVPVNRDFSTADPIPPRTWTIAFGWHMHPLFGIRHDFPYHPNVRPIFVSFHVNRLEMLTPDSLDYLRRYGPVGCRDWTTVDLLLSAGVDAFFTGCLTTTVASVFPPPAAVQRDPNGVVALIDVPPGAAPQAKRSVEVIRHGAEDMRDASLVRGVGAAIELLEDYQRRYHRIVTSRLHSYLPALSLQVPVRFLPANPSDVRFEGLVGMRPDGVEFRRMRDGIRELVAEAMTLVLSGASEDDVYARWRRLTSARVEAARARLGEPVTGPRLDSDLFAVVRAVRADSRRYGPPDDAGPGSLTDVALSLDQNLKPELPVMLEGLVSNASGPVRLWITSRGLDPGYERWVADAFPAVPMTFLPCDHVQHGSVGRIAPHITVTTMDRLMLPLLLDHLDRITYVDIDVVVRGDICELARTDLRGKPLAARTSLAAGPEVWRVVGNALPPPLAQELRRRMAARHRFGYRTFNAGILVLDLARMRADDFTATYLPWVERYGLNDQDVLLAYVGADRIELDPRWNSWPLIEAVEDPAVVHYLGSAKPWSASMLAPARDLWLHYQAVLHDRVGSPPGRRLDVERSAAKVQ